MILRKKNCIMGMTFIMLIYSMVSLAMEYGETRYLSLSLEDIAEMEIDCGAVFLKVTGIEGIDEIKVKAEIVADNKNGDELKEFIDDYVILSLDREGGKAVLKSKFERSITSKLFNWKVNQYINLTVDVPIEMNMAIKNGSGSIELEHIKGEIDINDGSGSIKVAFIEGDTNINDGSGSIGIKNVIGKVEINDGSGSMSIYDIEGDTKIHDGSGSMDLKKINGLLHITDGSGSITVKNTQGDLNIVDGSGSLTTTNIDGSVVIHDGSGSIHVDSISGDLEIQESLPPGNKNDTFGVIL